MRSTKHRNMGEVFADSDSSSSSEAEAEDETEGPKVKEEKQDEEVPDEEEEEEEEEQQDSNEQEVMKEENIQNKLFGSDDEDDAEFDDTKEETTPTQTQQVTDNKVLFDDDEDDDDVEFDDTTGIKGSSRTAEEEMEYRNEGNAVDESIEKQEELRSRTMEVVDYPKPTQTTMHMTKLPNIVNINPNAFDVSTFNADEEEKEYSGYVHNMIRWRYKTDPTTGEFIRDDNNRLIRESNARFVRWSDGSLSLHVNEEIFDIEEMKSNNAFPGLNGYLYLTQKATTSDKEGANTVLESLGAITSKLNARPSSIKSEAHRNLTLAVRQKNFKKARIEEFNVIQDPEKEKNKRIKNKDDLFKSENRSSHSRQSNRSGNSGYNQRRRNKYSMDERNYDSVNISALKRMNEDMMNAEDAGYDYGSADGSASDDDWEKKKRMDFKKARKGGRKVLEEEEEQEEEDQMEEESDDEEGQMMSNRKRNRQAVIDEDDED